MSEFFDAEYEIEARLVKGLRAIFEKDKRFIYNKNIKKTNLLITTDYPDVISSQELTPHVVIGNVSFQNNLHTSFGYNFYKESNHNGLKNSVNEYAYVIQYSATITSVASKNTSKDLASRIAWYISFGACKYLSEDLGLQISSLSKSSSVPSKQHPEKIFDTTIQISGTLYWIGKKLPEGISNIDKPLKGVNIRF